MAGPAAASAVALGLVLVACAPLAMARNAYSDRKVVDMNTPSSDMPAAGSSASRAPPPMVRPITIGAITYRPVIGNAETDGQAGGWLGAFDASGALLWKAKLYDNVRRRDIEGDVQDVYFQDMTLEADGSLRITNEAGQRFRFDPVSRAVTALPAPVPDPPTGVTAVTRRPGG
jgi:hypothetical protein